TDLTSMVDEYMVTNHTGIGRRQNNRLTPMVDEYMVTNHTGIGRL
ncbi:14295_t:CDS:2, partial [Funneliformis caledonium]